MGEPVIGSLGAAHTRFARAALLVYVGSAVVSLALLVVLLAEDRSHELAQVKDTLQFETQLRATYLGHEIDALERELERLGLRSEVNLGDNNPLPEIDLLRASHERSTFFNVGVAILGTDGRVKVSEPPRFLETGAPFADEQWFARVRDRERVEVVTPPAPSRANGVIWIVSPVIRRGVCTGVLVGGVDLLHAGALATDGTDPRVVAVLAAHEGELVARPHSWQEPPGPEFGSFLGEVEGRARLAHGVVAGRRAILAGAPVTDTGLVLAMVGDEEALFAPALAHMRNRLLVGLVLIILPLALLVAIFVRSLKEFRVSEELAVRDERLRHLGVAANVIAHEVKNLLNGLRMGLDMLLRGEAAKEPRNVRVAAELRRQIERMGEFSQELLIFSKGIDPRPVGLELPEFVDRIAAAARESAADLGVEVAIANVDPKVRVSADPGLIRIVLSNLVLNAVEALTGAGAPEHPRIDVQVGLRRGQAFVQVADNGPGVADAVRPLLFEPFVSAKPSGVGIGLALSRKIARAHGGDLVLAPAPRGASFVLTLPLETT